MSEQKRVKWKWKWKSVSVGWTVCVRVWVHILMWLLVKLLQFTQLRLYVNLDYYLPSSFWWKSAYLVCTWAIINESGCVLLFRCQIDIERTNERKSVMIKWVWDKLGNWKIQRLHGMTSKVSNLHVYGISIFDEFPFCIGLSFGTEGRGYVSNMNAGKAIFDGYTTSKHQTHYNAMLKHNMCPGIRRT